MAKSGSIRADKSLLLQNEKAVRLTAEQRISIVNALSKGMRICFYFLVFFLPLLFVPWIRTAFDLPKVVLLRIVTLLLLFLWVAQSAFSNKIILKKTQIDAYLLVFAALATISCFLSVHIPTSLLGGYGRYEGLLTLINYLVLFFLAVQVFDEMEHKVFLAKMMVFAAGIIALYGWYQYFGKDLFAWASSVEALRSSSTFGNAVLLGGYLAIVFPVALALSLSRGNRAERLLFGLVALLIFACAVTTFSRGAWAAILISSLVFGLFVSRIILAERKRVLGLLALFLVIIAFIALESPKTKSTTTSLVARAESVGQVEGSVADRIEIWKAALKMSRARPIFGFGPATFGLAYEKFMTPQDVRISGPLSRTDNAHNYLLQLAVTLGIPAVLALLTGFLIFFRRAYELLRELGQDEELLILAGFAAAVFGYSIYLLSGLSVVGNAPLAWVMAGLVLSRSKSTRALTLKKTSSTDVAVGGLAVGTFFLLLLGSWFYINQYRADAYFSKGMELLPDKKFGEVLSNYQKAVDLNPLVPLYESQMGSTYLYMARNTAGKEYFFNATEAFEKAKALSPGVSDDYYNLADAYIFAGERYHSDSYYQKAISELESSLKVKPNSPIAYYLLGRCYSRLEQPKPALGVFKKAVALYPDFAEGYYGIGFSYEKLGNLPKALAAYKKALNLKPKWPEPKKAIRDLEKKSS